MHRGRGMGGVVAGFTNKFLTWGITMIHRSCDGTLSKDHRILQRTLNSDIDRPQKAHLCQSAGFGRKYTLSAQGHPAGGNSGRWSVGSSLHKNVMIKVDEERLTCLHKLYWDVQGYGHNILEPGMIGEF